MRHIAICACTAVQNFVHCDSKTARFSKKKFLDMKCMFWFSLQLLFVTFLVLRRTERDVIITVHSSSSSAHYYCQILMKYEFSRKILEKCSNIKFHEKPSNGNRFVPCRRTDRLVANSRFSQLCDRA
jgi:hypothetical protein